MKTEPETAAAINLVHDNNCALENNIIIRNFAFTIIMAHKKQTPWQITKLKLESFPGLGWLHMDNFISEQLGYTSVSGKVHEGNLSYDNQKLYLTKGDKLIVSPGVIHIYIQRHDPRTPRLRFNTVLKTALEALNMAISDPAYKKIFIPMMHWGVKNLDTNRRDYIHLDRIRHTAVTHIWMFEFDKETRKMLWHDINHTSISSLKETDKRNKQAEYKKFLDVVVRSYAAPWINEHLKLRDEPFVGSDFLKVALKFNTG